MSKPFKISAEYAAPRSRTKTAIARAGACVGLSGIRITYADRYRQISRGGTFPLRERRSTRVVLGQSDRLLYERRESNNRLPHVTDSSSGDLGGE
jgi:hypothetical protein